MGCQAVYKTIAHMPQGLPEMLPSLRCVASNMAGSPGSPCVVLTL